MLTIIFAFLIFVNVFPADATQAEGKSGWVVMSDKVCGDKLCSEVTTGTKNFTFSSIAYFPPPLIQISQGVDPSNVTCTEGKSLILKQSNGLPACVNLSSIEKLITRGWAIYILPDYVDENNTSEIFLSGTHLTTSEMVTYFDNASGYLAKPVGDGNYPGVVMIHE